VALQPLIDLGDNRERFGGFFYPGFYNRLDGLDVLFNRPQYGLLRLSIRARLRLHGVSLTRLSIQLDAWLAVVLR
jgi:hypothetical protein